MAKMIKYTFLSAEINHGTEENPDIEQIFANVRMDWNEVNEEIARREAYLGEYEIYDDGLPEPELPENDDAYADMAAAIREGVNGI